MRLPFAIIALSTLALSGCDSLFEVENPTDILAETLDDPRMVDALANSAEGAVSDAYDLAVQYGGLPADGISHVSTNQGNLALDRGVFDDYNERHETLFNELSAARWTATEVTGRLEALVDDPSTDARVGWSLYWDAIARITLADLFEEVSFDGEAPLAPAQVYEAALLMLEEVNSIASAAGATELVAASYGTMARVHRSLYFESGASDLTAFEQAATDAQAALDVAADFSTSIRYQTPGSENNIFQALSGGSNYDVMGATYANMVDPASGLIDPRIQHGESQGESVTGDLIYYQTKYDDRSDDIPVTRWQEAELIIAEYELLAGTPGEAENRINRVRGAAGLPDFSSADPATIQAQIIYERKAEFWLEMRRWQDMRYYDIVPDRWYPQGKELGIDRRFPPSLRERLANDNY